MSHELHLSKLMKRLIFSCFHFHHPQYLAGESLWNKLHLGPQLKTIPVRRLVRNAAAPLVECVPPGGTWVPVQTCTCICWLWVALTAGCWTDLKAPSLAWLWPVWKQSFLCWGSSPVYLVRSSWIYLPPICAQTCSVGAVSAPWCVLHFSPERTPRSAWRNWREQWSAGALQPSKPLMHHEGTWSQAWFQPVSGAG